MKALSADDIRSSFVNASQGEADRLPLPGLHEVMWDDREYLGWRDPQSPQRGYIVFWRGDSPLGMVLRAASRGPNRSMSAFCSLCRTQQPAHQVSLFSVPKAGQAGRDGNTVGTYICSDLACSTLIRILPPPSQMQPNPAEMVASRGAGLLARLEGFTNEVLKPAE